MCSAARLERVAEHSICAVGLNLHALYLRDMTGGELGGTSGVQGAMTFDEATRSLLLLARQNGGTVAAAQVEADEPLSGDHDYPGITTLTPVGHCRQFRKASWRSRSRGFAESEGGSRP
jgi:hypothetical protein